jgi:diaminohydroxyphosphoribosylaminopyrimidine deaminase/5-amino-6-(5-phosphoribosylamino)uracil reductase
MATAPSQAHDSEVMARAMALAAGVRLITSPNPWVGCVVRTTDGQWFEGATEPPGGRHAERVALDAVRAGGADPVGATVWCTLEPCSHHGRTSPCTDALLAAGVARVVAGITDPDARVSGRGLQQLLAAGVDTSVGVRADDITEQLRPYLHHRRTGRPFVILKMASTLDGRTSAADGSSRWITGDAARAEVHRLRAASDAVLVGAGTVRADDPALTVRLVDGPQPRRVVLGTAPTTARVHPCLEWQGPVDDLLERLGAEGVLQVLVEGGARVAADLHRGGFVDRYVMHLAPAFMGGDDGASVFAGGGAATMAGVWRGRVRSVRMLGDDVEVVVDAHDA